MNISKKRIRRGKVGAIIVSPVALVITFFTIITLFTQLDDVTFQDTLKWFKLFLNLSFSDFFHHNNHDAFWMLLVWVSFFYGVLGIIWCYVYDRKPLRDCQVYSSNRDGGFMFVYCALPMLIIFFGMLLSFWMNNVFSEAWLELVTEEDELGLKALGVFAYSLFILGLGFVISLFLAMIVKGLLIISEYRKLGPTILTLNQGHFVEGDKVIARFSLKKGVANIRHATLKCTHQFCPPNNRNIQFKLLHDENISSNITDCADGSIVELVFTIPLDVMPDTSDYLAYLVSDFFWAVRVDLEFVGGGGVGRGWLINVDDPV